MSQFRGSLHGLVNAAGGEPLSETVWAWYTGTRVHSPTPHTWAWKFGPLGNLAPNVNGSDCNSVRAWMPNSISPTKFRKGLLRPAVSSELKRVSCAFSRDRILLCCIGDASRADQDFFGEKPFYHGFRPLPLLKNDKLLTLLRLSVVGVQN